MKSSVTLDRMDEVEFRPLEAPSFPIDPEEPKPPNGLEVSPASKLWPGQAEDSEKAKDSGKRKGKWWGVEK